MRSELRSFFLIYSMTGAFRSALYGHLSASCGENTGRALRSELRDKLHKDHITQIHKSLSSEGKRRKAHINVVFELDLSTSVDTDSLKGLTRSVICGFSALLQICDNGTFWDAACRICIDGARSPALNQDVHPSLRQAHSLEAVDELQHLILRYLGIFPS